MVAGETGYGLKFILRAILSRRSDFVLRFNGRNSQLGEPGESDFLVASP
jgi:hypothetical protein